MFSNDIGLSRSAATGSPAVAVLDLHWGTASHFRRLARVDVDTAAYWLATVHRPAHRISHPFLNVEGCPGCAFETAAQTEATR
jgi:hypothetical protein